MVQATLGFIMDGICIGLMLVTGIKYIANKIKQSINNLKH